jgi:hypothetical protein
VKQEVLKYVSSLLSTDPERTRFDSFHPGANWARSLMDWQHFGYNSVVDPLSVARQLLVAATLAIGREDKKMFNLQ